MALIYRIACATCGHGPAIPSEQRPNHHRSFSIEDSFIELTTSDGQQVALAHPGESTILEEYGYTWRSARAEQRLHLVTPRICSKCGQLSLYREPYRSFAGCLVLVTLPIAILALVLLSSASAKTGIQLLAVTVLALSLVLQRYDRRRAALQPPTACPSCGGDTIPVGDVGTKKMPCPKCGAVAVECEFKAIS